ncbi:putative methyltransferase At1g22800, mitochondrial [Selaginella moellendorffii]|nr:putative methyltransferase At1g22800, mitochondrial [Selaginella moellendorffii]|eukprot:XP_002991003.2 putative methyltransferase At1g22800, mitochondrial [Selaginella moellendorffii]
MAMAMASRRQALREWRRALAMASQDPGEAPMNIFDRKLKRSQRDRAAVLRADDNSLMESVTETLLDRLLDCKRQFPVALNVGGALDYVQKLLKGRGGVEKLFMMDLSLPMLNKCAESSASEMECVHLVADEEFLPIKPGSLDLVVSCLGLHWVNNVPGAMTQFRQALKPDGFFLASIFGGDTLRELRISCHLAQLEREGGISPRVSPFSRVSDAGNLLTRAGFAIPAVDIQDYVMKYSSAMDLIDHIRQMGEMNCLIQRNPILKRDTALAAAAIYESMFREEDGSIPATFQVIYMGGWSPHSSQQKPARRGSGTVSFADIEKALGDKK